MATIKYKDENGWQEIAVGGGGSTEIDNKMSDTSNNAVANKTVKEYVDAMYSRDFNNDFNEEFFI